MKKRLLTVLSVILTFMMLGSTFSFAATVAPVTGDQFTDVSAEDWYKEYVDFVAEKGYMIGTSETTFEPQSDLTRAMFATILARYDKAVVDDSKATIFNDVDVDQWYTGSIGWANEKAIVQGYGDGNFGTNDSITRQDLSLMIIRYIRYYEKAHNVKIKNHGGEYNGDITFTDEDQIRQDVETPQAVKDLVTYGVLLGYPDGTFKPTQNITRAEAAAIIKRLDWIVNSSKPSGGGGGSSVTTEKYIVTAALTGPDTLNAEWPIELSKEYTVSSNGAGDQTIDVVMKDLVTGDNATLLGNGIASLLDDLESAHTKTVDVDGVTYVVNVDPETKQVTATKDGASVTDWDKQLDVEQKLYEKRMDDFATAAKIAEAGATEEWGAFVKALSPDKLINAAPKYLQFKEQTDYVKAVQEAATNAGAVLKKLGDKGFKESYDALVAYMAAAPLGIDLSGYTVDNTVLKTTTDETSGKFDEALKNSNGILRALTDNGKEEYTALFAQEELTQEGLLDTINQRISRAWADQPDDSAAIVAFLKANMVDVDSKFFGNYELKVTVKKA